MHSDHHWFSSSPDTLRIKFKVINYCCLPIVYIIIIIIIIEWTWWYIYTSRWCKLARRCTEAMNSECRYHFCDWHYVWWEKTDLEIDYWTFSCSFHLDPCARVNCNHGRCEVDRNTAVCRCYPGYTGHDCLTPTGKIRWLAVNFAVAVVWLVFWQTKTLLDLLVLLLFFFFVHLLKTRVLEHHAIMVLVSTKVHRIDANVIEDTKVQHVIDKSIHVRHLFVTMEALVSHNRIINLCVNVHRVIEDRIVTNRMVRVSLKHACGYSLCPAVKFRTDTFISKMQTEKSLACHLRKAISSFLSLFRYSTSFLQTPVTISIAIMDDVSLISMMGHPIVIVYRVIRVIYV